ncbi:MAG: serine/threonine-protein kinase [Verrucomicrobiales bacterium]
MGDAPTPEELAAQLEGFEVHSLIAAGGMGAVYRAVQIRLDRQVAIKVLPSSMASPEFAQRFQSEAKAMAKLQHIGIVSIYDFGTSSEGLPYMVMELVDGQSMHEAIHRKSLSLDQVIDTIYLVCDAIQYAHDHGMAHRDIKPANILLPAEGGVKVADFGLARLLNQGHFARNTEEDGVVLGTPGYTAPEVMVPGATVDHHADIYALGALLYEAMTGTPPPDRANWVPPSQICGSSPLLDAVILRAMRKEAGERYESADKLKTAIQHALRTQPNPAQASFRGISSASAMAPAPVRRPIATSDSSSGGLMIGIAAAAVIGVVIFLWKPWDSGPKGGTASGSGKDPGGEKFGIGTGSPPPDRGTDPAPPEPEPEPTPAAPAEPSGLMPIDSELATSGDPPADPPIPAPAAASEQPPPELAKLIGKFREDLVALEAPHVAEAVDLNTKYLAALGRLGDKFRQSGDTDGLIATQLERDLIEKLGEGDLAESGPTYAHGEVDKMVETYHEHAAKLSVKRASAAAEFTRNQIGSFQALLADLESNDRQPEAVHVTEAVADLEGRIEMWDEEVTAILDAFREKMEGPTPDQGGAAREYTSTPTPPISPPLRF